jgi:hypothetical protein
MEQGNCRCPLLNSVNDVIIKMLAMGVHKRLTVSPLS